MDSKTFFDLTARMREAQKLYFKTRSSSALKASKKLETQIDEEIERVNKILAERQQPKLF